MQFLVQNEQMVPEEDKYFLDSEQVNEIMNFLLDMASRKDFRSKELGDRLLESIDKYPFVRGVTETREF